MKAQVRRAEVDDAHAIARVHVETWRAAYAGIVPAGYLERLDVTARIHRWEQSLAENASATFVAVNEDGRVVGWSSFGASRDPDSTTDGELYAIYVDAAHWGYGHGRALLVHAVDMLRDQGFATVTLWVLAANGRARRFYACGGFAPDGAEKIVVIGGAELPELRYRWSCALGGVPTACDA